MNVYFISGFLANCKVFDKLKLPSGFEKKYIEWYIPQGDESLLDYSLKMAENIDTSRPFVLVGYSLGGLVIQEMNKFLNPEKNIIISSIKNESEIPALFKLGKKINFANRFPMDIVSDQSVLAQLYVRFIYHIPPDTSNQFIANIDPVYIKWALNQIFNWIPERRIEKLYHIHGTKDRSFPVGKINKAILVNNGDHLMVMKKNREVSKILANILLEE